MNSSSRWVGVVKQATKRVIEEGWGRKKAENSGEMRRGKQA
jgi:hypothetical protein